jgi:hypothetical protein
MKDSGELVEEDLPEEADGDEEDEDGDADGRRDEQRNLRQVAAVELERTA